VKKTIIALLSVLLIALSFTIFYGPSFLTYSDKPVKSDAVVLFLGDENRTREMEAEKLLRQGYAQCLIIPARGEICRIMPDGRLKLVSRDIKYGDLLFRLRKKAIYGKYYEDTHMEVLEAKRIMDEAGLRSAILVSSSYHMRRIRMIAGKVFGDGKNTFNCVPTKFEKQFDASDWRVRSHRDILLSEYVKIGWFMLYRIFG
jgi:hypothetical protein